MMLPNDPEAPANVIDASSSSRQVDPSARWAQRAEGIGSSRGFVGKVLGPFQEAAMDALPPKGRLHVFCDDGGLELKLEGHDPCHSERQADAVRQALMDVDFETEATFGRFRVCGHASLSKICDVQARTSWRAKEARQKPPCRVVQA